jgi:hypothetical protein
VVVPVPEPPHLGHLVRPRQHRGHLWMESNMVSTQRSWPLEADGYLSANQDMNVTAMTSQYALSVCWSIESMNRSNL